MRVVIVDDALIVREGLARLLSGHGVVVVGAVGSVTELRRLLERAEPDAIVLDIRLPPGFRTEGLDAAAELAVTRPGLGVLVLSQYREPGYARSLLAAGAARRGYLLKDSLLDPGQLLTALRRVVAGATVVDPAVIRTALAAAPDDRLAVLTTREREVLGLVAEGLTDRGIGEQLSLSTRTVETHVQRIFTKLRLPDSGQDNRRVLAVLAYLSATTRAGTAAT